MKNLAFLCVKGLESFIEPIALYFENDKKYLSRRYYCQTNQEIIAGIKWADIVFLEWANELSIMASQVYEIKKKGVICRLHSYESLTDMPTKVDWSMVDYLVFVAPHIREIVKGKIPDLEKRVCTKVIPNGIDLDKIKMNEKLSPYDIAYVCNINHKKEPALALQIMAELDLQTYEFGGKHCNKKYKLHIAGAFQDQRYEIYMKHMAKEMGVEDNILYYGFVKDMDSFWEGKGIILSTSIHEGHPFNIMEGMARGLRPVIHNFYGAKDMYPPFYRFNTIGEAVGHITDIVHTKGERLFNESGNHRQFIEKKGWTLKNQVKQIKKLVGKL